MAVVEYMLLNEGDHRRHTPGFIGDRGHWYNPADHTLVGWVKDNRDFYVPDTIVTLTKEQLVQRILGMHAVNPMRVNDPNFVPSEQNQLPASMTEAEVRALVESWYDNFVAKNTAEDNA